jgi:hypothetical protein
VTCPGRLVLNSKVRPASGRLGSWPKWTHLENPCSSDFLAGLEWRRVSPFVLMMLSNVCFGESLIKGSLIGFLKIIYQAC